MVRDACRVFLAIVFLLQKQFTIIFEEMLDIIPNLEYNMLDKILRGANMKYMSASEAAAKWGLSSRRVGILCNEGRIDGAQKAGATWIIPEEAGKPSDARIKSGKYIKLKKKSNGMKSRENSR